MNLLIMEVVCSIIEKFIRFLRKVTKKALVIAIACFILFLIVIYITPNTTTLSEKFVPTTMNFTNINILEYMNPIESDEFYDGTETMREIIAGDGNIFFLETAHIKDNHQINLKVRQGCAVESAALMNPTMKVHLFIFSNKSWSYSNKTKTIITQLRGYENIVIRHVHLETYFKNSPVDEWWNTTDDLRNSNWFTSHVSDVLRYLTLWKFSGIYLDHDVVIKSSLERLKNFAAAENFWYVAAGVLGFDATDDGRRYADACLYDIVTDFRGDVWGYNGPGVITRVLKRICNRDIICQMNADISDGFTVFPPSIFYPISGDIWMRYFDDIDKNKTMKKINNALAIHVWNKESHSTIVKVGSEVPYELIAKKYCPKVYKTCSDIF